MPAVPADDHELIETIADAIGIETTAAIRNDCLDIATEHEASAGTLGGRIDPVPEELPPSCRGDDSYNAFIHVYDGPRRPTDGGQLDGLAVAVKDNLAAAGLPLTCGSAEFEVIPDFDAVAVERLLDAGAKLVGKTNMEPFALGPTGEFSDYGRVENPRYEGRVPGGSSSGSAAAVAGGLVDAALGSDTGGSVRIPAACCGLVGVKPTHGLVPQYGFVNLGVSMDTIGPLTHDVETAVRILDTISGVDRRDPTSAGTIPTIPLPERVDQVADATTADEPMLVGVPDSLLDPASELVEKTVDAVVDRLRDEPSFQVEAVALDLGGLEDAFFHLNVVEFGWLLCQTGVYRGLGTGYDEQLRAAFETMMTDSVSSEHLARRVLPSMVVDAKTNGQAYTAARNEAQLFQRRLDEQFADLDALLSPTLRTVPPAYDRSKAKTDAIRELASNTLPFNLSGDPAVSVPVGEPDGLPVSVQVVTPRFTDDRALYLAGRVESLVA